MERILRIKDVQDLMGISRSTIWRLEQRGLFPLRRQLGARIVGWLEGDIDAWLESLPTAQPKITTDTQNEIEN
jgi:prophage regulatory protein